MPRNGHGFTFLEWHIRAGWSSSNLARCHQRFFTQLYKAWQANAVPADWQGSQPAVELWT